MHLMTQKTISTFGIVSLSPSYVSSIIIKFSSRRTQLLNKIWLTKYNLIRRQIHMTLQQTPNNVYFALLPCAQNAPTYTKTWHQEVLILPYDRSSEVKTTVAQPAI